MRPLLGLYDSALWCSIERKRERGIIGLLYINVKDKTMKWAPMAYAVTLQPLISVATLDRTCITLLPETA